MYEIEKFENFLNFKIYTNFKIWKFENQFKSIKYFLLTRLRENLQNFKTDHIIDHINANKTFE